MSHLDGLNGVGEGWKERRKGWMARDTQCLERRKSGGRANRQVGWMIYVRMYSKFISYLKGPTLFIVILVEYFSTLMVMLLVHVNEREVCWIEGKRLPSPRRRRETDFLPLRVRSDFRRRRSRTACCCRSQIPISSAHASYPVPIPHFQSNPTRGSRYHW